MAAANPCRVNDMGLGTCPAHDSPKSYTTIFCTGAPTVMIEGSPAVRVGDVGISTCGHPTVAMTGGAIGIFEGAPSHRIGDTGTNPGPYVATTAAVTVGTA